MSQGSAGKGQSLREDEPICFLIALGANLPSSAGGPRETLEAALEALGVAGLTPVARSRWWRTPAWPSGAGPDYVNGAAAVRGQADPEAVLALLHRVEAALGRVRDMRWGPRACDIDLIAAGDRILPDREAVAAWIAKTGAAGREAPPRLMLPHPRMQERGFVLAPLAEVAPDWRHPLLGATVVEMLAALPEEAMTGLQPLPEIR